MKKEQNNYNGGVPGASRDAYRVTTATGLKCPECKGDLSRLDKFLHMSAPKKWRVGCDKCGYEGFIDS